MQGWNYEARAKEVEAAQRAAFADLAQLRNAREIRPLALSDIEPQATRSQMDLFASVPKDIYDWVEELLQRLPRKQQRDHFRKLYLRELKSIKDDGSIAFMAGNKQVDHANNFLRDLMGQRLGKVFARYDFDLAWLAKTAQEKWEWAHGYAADDAFSSFGLVREHESLDEKKRVPFYLMTNNKLEKMAATIGDIFQTIQVNFFTQLAEMRQDYSDEELEGVLGEIYAECGELCEKVGFMLPYWESYQHKISEGESPNFRQMEIALNKVVCQDWWGRLLRKTQRQMLEHVAIACGQVRQGVSAYISFDGFREYKSQLRKNYDFLRGQIIQNIDNPEEQVELFDMWLKSNANPTIRRYEMMTRLRGVEEWAEEKGYKALFLTLTAPSSFHAQHSKGGQNGKWSGASPKETHAYLNKVWGQLRALWAKRGIKAKGMRVAEPHHDATPHWHLLVYVLERDVEETVRLFRMKALELDGDEQGAEKHRCKVEFCDKTKGSATAYIAKYISKNIDGFDEQDLKSDEAEELPLKENARRVRAWASLWGIRQFQFYGVGAISVWRELRRCMQPLADDKLEELRLGADLSDYAFYMEKQGGGSFKDAVCAVHYEEREANKYGESGSKIDGIYNRFKASVEVIKTRSKVWAILRKPRDWAEQKAIRAQEQNHQTTSANAEAKNTGLRPAWTCVNNCNPKRSKGSAIERGLSSAEQLVEFFQTHQAELKRLEYAVKSRGIPEHYLNDYHRMHLINGAEIKLHDGARLKFKYGEIEYVN